MERQKLTVAEFEVELKKMLAEKSVKDKNFSLRAMALRLGVVPSSLQKVVRGERQLGFRLAREVAEKMNIELIKQSHRRTPRQRGWKLALDSDSPSHVSWMNLAILEMLKLDDFVPDERWIAQRLGVPQSVITTALDTMVSAKMLERNPKGPWRDLMGDASTGAEGYRSTSAVRQMQKAILAVSAQKIDPIPQELRDHGFSIFPISNRQIAQLKKKIHAFHQEMCRLTENPRTSKDQIYALEISFFPLTNGPKN